MELTNRTGLRNRGDRVLTEFPSLHYRGTVYIICADKIHAPRRESQT